MRSVDDMRRGCGIIRRVLLWGLLGALISVAATACATGSPAPGMTRPC